MEHRKEGTLSDYKPFERRIPQCIPSHSSTTQVSVNHFYLLDTIEDPLQYIELLQSLRNAAEHDTIILHINSPGGRVDIAVQIVAAMKDCAGTVITSLEGRAYSAATVIFLNGHQFNVSDNSNMMIHYYSSYSYGKGHDLESHAFFNKMYFNKMFRETYEGFLTIEEIDTIVNGADLWLESEEVLERLHAFNSHRELRIQEIRKNQAIETLRDIDETKEMLIGELDYMGFDAGGKAKPRPSEVAPNITPPKKVTKKKVTKKKVTKKKATKKKVTTKKAPPKDAE